MIKLIIRFMPNRLCVIMYYILDVLRDIESRAYSGSHVGIAVINIPAVNICRFSWVFGKLLSE